MEYWLARLLSSTAETKPIRSPCTMTRYTTFPSLSVATPPGRKITPMEVPKSGGPIVVVRTERCSQQANRCERSPGLSRCAFLPVELRPNGKVDKLISDRDPATAARETERIALGLGEVIQLDGNTSVRMAEFFPDYVVRDGQVYTGPPGGKSRRAPIRRLRRDEQSRQLLVHRLQDLKRTLSSPIPVLEAIDLKMGYFTGLEVSHEPGQWAVWGESC